MSTFKKTSFFCLPLKFFIYADQTIESVDNLWFVFNLESMDKVKSLELHAENNAQLKIFYKYLFS